MIIVNLIMEELYTPDLMQLVMVETIEEKTAMGMVLM